MGNPLVDLQKLVGPDNAKTFIARVLVGGAVKVQVQIGDNDTPLSVWGSADLGETVLVSNRKIVAIVGRETVNPVTVP